MCSANTRWDPVELCFILGNPLTMWWSEATSRCPSWIFRTPNNPAQHAIQDCLVVSSASTGNVNQCKRLWRRWPRGAPMLSTQTFSSTIHASQLVELAGLKMRIILEVKCSNRSLWKSPTVSTSVILPIRSNSFLSLNNWVWLSIFLAGLLCRTYHQTILCKPSWPPRPELLKALKTSLSIWSWWMSGQRHALEVSSRFGLCIWPSDQVLAKSSDQMGGRGS